MVPRWERVERRARSGGDMRGEELVAEGSSRGEGCPERERRISWSMVVVVDWWGFSLAFD